MRSANRLLILLLLFAVSIPAAAPAVAAPRLQGVSPCALAVASALAQRGKPYTWGAKGPNTFDCSGLTQYAWGEAGYRIGASTFDQIYAGQAIACRLSDLNDIATTCWEPGDLIFLRNGGQQHVAIYVGAGLFADAYNASTGVLVHRVENDNYYRSYFWMARRIVDCDGTLPPPDITPDLISGTAGLEDIPDLLPAVSVRIAQCGDCDPNGTPVLPARDWGEQWPSGWEQLNLALVFQKVISWLSWQISQIAREVLCWLLTMLQWLINGLLVMLNAVLMLLNAIWKILVLVLLNLRSMYYSLFDLLNSVLDLLVALLSAISLLVPFLSLIWQAFIWVGIYVGMLIQFLWTLVAIMLGIVGWVGGLLLGLWGMMINALLASSTTLPALSNTNRIYWMMRGAGEAVVDSEIGWMYNLTIGLIYIGAVAWAARFLSSAEAS